MSTVVERDINGPIHPLTRTIRALAKERVCLHCDQMFPSVSPGNRICNWCKTYLHQREIDQEDPHQEQQRVVKVGRVDAFAHRVETGEEFGSRVEVYSAASEDEYNHVAEEALLRELDVEVGEDVGEGRGWTVVPVV